MTKRKPPRGEFDPEHSPAFFAAIGIDNPHLTNALETNLQQIAAAFWRQMNIPTVGTQNKKLRQYLRYSRKKRELRHALGLEQQIVSASILRKNPDADLADISADVAEYRFTLSDLDQDEMQHEADIEFLIGLSRDYRKRLVTKLVVEPGLILLRENDIKPSRTLPLSRMAHTLFDLIGIAAADRVSDATVQRVWRRQASV